MRITHLPSGTVVAMQDEKSQIQNRAKAMVVLRARLLKAEQDRQEADMSAQRRGQVGAGSRTDKIRTYNYKENRVTDHRINLTLYKLDQVLAGDLTELTDALMADKRARQLAGEEQAGAFVTWLVPDAGVDRGELVAELAGVVGAPDEARWIVKEALGAGRAGARAPLRPGPGLLAPISSRPPAPWRRGGGGGAPAVRLRALALPFARPGRPPACADPAARDRAGGRGGPGGGAGTGPPPGRRPRRRGCRHGFGRHGAGAGRRARTAVVGEVWATDVSADALAVAAANLEAVRAAHGGRLPPVTLVEGSWLEPLPASLRGRVDLVVANPPYVSEDEWAGLDPEVRREPRSALVAGPGRDGTPGLAEVEAVLAQARLGWVRPARWWWSWRRPGGSGR